ncbi:hypothetical protein NDU88_006653 [Pleurodeles waltl]|uniref:Uncharacterized protein n=1 Tax=Pleurodeles waltl TaxID=8319 RepID=A0AAV7QII4_PLEWA|nr:hypothetical protein NDU88_006653 [Pleurodeles waltl]
MSPAARAQADSSTVTFHSGRSRVALAHALSTSVRPGNRTGPLWRHSTVSIFPPVAYVVIATLGNPRHLVWPAGFCPDRWVAGRAQLQCGHLAVRQAPPRFPFSIFHFTAFGYRLRDTRCPSTSSEPGLIVSGSHGEQFQWQCVKNESAFSWKSKTRKGDPP